MISAIDTNVLVYAVGGNGPERRAEAVAIIRRLQAQSIVVPAQVIGELFSVLVRKIGFRPGTTQLVVQQFVQDYTIAPSTDTVLSSAMTLSIMSKISIWDAIVLASAGEAGCRILLSEDMQNGFTWSGVTVVNPFANPMHPLLELALGTRS
jgi:predicted nucleic acid-binding protein